jgi:hypothetical protein
MKHEINGKMEDEVKKIAGLQEVIGLKAKNVFGVLTPEELDEKMADMAVVDLQRLAVSCGVSGGGSRAVLKAKIRNEFSKFMRGGHGLNIQSSGKMKLLGRDKKSREQQVFDLMTEGIR